MDGYLEKKQHITFWGNDVVLLFRTNGLQSLKDDELELGCCSAACPSDMFLYVTLRMGKGNSSAFTIYPFIFWDLPCLREISTRFNQSSYLKPIYIPILLPVCLSVLLLAVSTLPWLTQPIPDLVICVSLASLQYCWRHSQLETAHEWRGYCTWLRKNPPSTDNQLGPSFRSRNIYLNSHVAEKYCGAPQSLKIKYQTLVK